jgi:deazaflavin-dependent oxidoreductase (nitroreductase family)
VVELAAESLQLIQLLDEPEDAPAQRLPSGRLGGQQARNDPPDAGDDELVLAGEIPVDRVGRQAQLPRQARDRERAVAPIEKVLRGRLNDLGDLLVAIECWAVPRHNGSFPQIGATILASLSRETLARFEDTDQTLAALVAGDSRQRLFGRLLGGIVDLPLVGAWAARLGRLPNQIPFLTPLITRYHAWLLRKSGGRLRRSWLFAAGQPVISLTTTGRRSGEPRSTAVACFVAGDELVVAGMNLGRTSHPAWALNLKANPRGRIEIRGRTVEVSARQAEGAERDRLWRRWLELQPSAGAFREISGRQIPLFVLSESKR